jgi:hypothetical protein
MTMCDRIQIWNGPEVEEIDGDCLCVASQERIWQEIIKMAFENKLLPLTIDQRLVIERDPFGYIVKVDRKTYQGPDVTEFYPENERAGDIGLKVAGVRCQTHNESFVHVNGKSYCPKCFPNGPEEGAGDPDAAAGGASGSHAKAGLASANNRTGFAPTVPEGPAVPTQQQRESQPVPIKYRLFSKDGHELKMIDPLEFIAHRDKYPMHAIYREGCEPEEEEK